MNSTVTSYHILPNGLRQNSFCEGVRVGRSKIPKAGRGLFASRSFNKGDLLCTYGGSLVDGAEAIYLDPCYMVNFENGKGWKLAGDNQEGDLGLFANGTHPSLPSVTENARFSLSYDRKWILPGETGRGEAPRGRFCLFAVKEIQEGEEIIVDYGSGYWATLKRWDGEDRPVKSKETLARDERARKRARKNPEE